MQKHKIIALVVALPVAFILWIYVITTVTPEMTRTIYNIPVTFDGVIALEERNLMITSGEVSRVNLELEGNRVSLSKLTSDSIRVVADCSRITEPGEYNLTYNVSYPELNTNNQINILRRNPTTVAITVTQVITKNIPVEFLWEGAVQDGYLFDAQKVEFDFDQISVTGPDFAVAPITKAVVAYDVSALTETTVEQCSYTLLQEDGTEVTLGEDMSVNVEDITVTLPIQRYKDIKLTVDLQSGGGATENNAVVTLDYETIRVAGAASAVDELEDFLVLGSVDLADVVNSKTVEFPVVLPTGLLNLSGIENVQATVKITGLTRENIAVTQITLLNVPEGRTAELTTKSVTVVLRGPSADMQLLTEKDISIKVDLSSCTQTGAFTMPAVVIINGYPRIGVIGEAEVGVSLS